MLNTEYISTSASDSVEGDEIKSGAMFDASRPLVSLEQEMDTGAYSVSTLLQYDDAYRKYLAAGRPRQPKGLWRLLRSRL